MFVFGGFEARLDEVVQVYLGESLLGSLAVHPDAHQAQHAARHGIDALGYGAEDCVEQERRDGEDPQHAVGVDLEQGLGQQFPGEDDDEGRDGDLQRQLHGIVPAHRQGNA